MKTRMRAAALAIGYLAAMGCTTSAFAGDAWDTYRACVYSACYACKTFNNCNTCAKTCDSIRPR